MIIKICLVLLGGYFVGGLLGGGLIARLKKTDLSRAGSGNPGATNVLRTMGPLPGALTLLFDVAKGMLVVAAAGWLGLPVWVKSAAGIAAVAGHNWPITAGFRGGKGIATSLGTLIIISPWTALIALSLWIAITLPTGYVSVGSIIAIFMVPVLIAVLHRGEPGLIYMLVYGITIAVISILRHRVNIIRLRQGRENNLWRKGKTAE